MKYLVDLVRASSYCWDPPAFGQLVVVRPWNLILSNGDAVQVFKLDRPSDTDSVWSDGDFENYPFFNPIATGVDPSVRRQTCDGYLLRRFRDFDPRLAGQFASYFSAIECLLVPAK